MKKKFVLPILLLLFPLCASEPTDQPRIYDNHGIKFDIPANWSVAKEEQLNNTQFDETPINDLKILLSESNSSSSIRIDIVEIPQTKWLMEMFNDGPHCVTGILESFYIRDIVGLDRTREHMGGGSGFDLKPDNAKATEFRYGSNGTKWNVVWLKSEYNNKFIGVHAVYHGEYAVKPLSIRSHKTIPESLYKILNSISFSETNGKQKIAS